MHAYQNRFVPLLVAAVAFVAAGVGPSETARAGADPLPSWNESKSKEAIIAFVAAVTQSGGDEYVPPAERIAVFDNDGTLWAEQPIYFQFQFAIDRVAAMAPQHPEWDQMPALSAIVRGDLKAFAATGQKGAMEVLAATHAGITTETFSNIVDGWLAGSQHPKTRRLYTEMVYQPMLELLAYLRDNGFKTFIVSGGGVEFMRRFAEKVYGIPPEQVVGSSGAVTFEIAEDGKPSLIKQPKVEFIDDGPGKPVGINRFIGRRPIAAFGNSDGDLEMLQWTCGAPGRRLCLYVHHTDAGREWAYDRTSHIGKLDKGLDEAKEQGWPIVNMKSDWKTVFPK